MSLLKDLKPPVKVKPCYVAMAAEKLEKEDKQILLEAVLNPEWAIIPLSTALAQRGINLSRTTLERHRKGLCQCFKA